MKITKNLKTSAEAAKSQGYENILITRGGSKWGTAVSVYQLEEVLQAQIGSDFHSRERGYFPTKNNPIPEKTIKLSTMRKLS